MLSRRLLRSKPGDGPAVFALVRPAVSAGTVALVLFLAGCAPQAVESDLLDGPPSELTIPSPNLLRGSSHVLSLGLRIDEAWTRALQSMAPLYWILVADSEDHMLLFLEIDGLSDGTFVEFPMAALMTREGSGATSVHVQPLESGNLGLPEEKLDDYRACQKQRADAFLLRLQADLEPGQRWPWLLGSD